MDAAFIPLADVRRCAALATECELRYVLLASCMHALRLSRGCAARYAVRCDCQAEGMWFVRMTIEKKHRSRGRGGALPRGAWGGGAFLNSCGPAIYILRCICVFAVGIMGYSGRKKRTLLRAGKSLASLPATAMPLCPVSANLIIRDHSELVSIAIVPSFKGMRGAAHAGRHGHVRVEARAPGDGGQGVAFAPRLKKCAQDPRMYAYHSDQFMRRIGMRCSFRPAARRRGTGRRR